MEISVIVCCYNPNIDKLKNTIISIMNQKDVNFQTIITDDGSCNDYYNELESFITENYKEKDIVFTKLEKNSGTVKNLINAMTICKTKYYKVISPGDYFFDEYSLKKYYDELCKNNYDLVFSDAVFYDGNTIVRDRKYPTTSLVFNDTILKRNYYVYNYLFLGATVAGVTDVVLDVLNRIAGKILYIEDMSTTAILLLDGKRIHGINEPLMWYEYNTGVSSTLEGCARLDRDIQQIAEYIVDNYSGDLVRKIKFLKKEKHNKVIKCIRYPSVILSKILRKFFKAKKYDIDIQQKNNIIQIIK